MKKILLTLLSAFMIAICCVGCGSVTPSAPKLDEAKPWFALAGFVSEQITYDVTQYYIKDTDFKSFDDLGKSDNSIPVTENSYLVYTLTEEEGEDGILCKLTADFNITYKDDCEYTDSYFWGKTDTIKSTSIFRKDNLTAVSTTKEVVLETEPTLSYSFTVDYNKGEAHYESNGQKRDITFKKDSYIDNEYLYYYVRAFVNLGGSLSESFNVVNWYGCFLNGKNGKFATSAMNASFYREEKVNINNEEFLNGFDDAGKDTEDKALLSNTISISLSDTKTGTSLYASYSSVPYRESVEESEIRVKEARKILTKILTYEYLSSGIYSIEYTLSDFKQTFKQND